MAVKTTEIEQIHDLIELMKLNYEGATKLSLAEIKDFRKLLQDYSLHQENTENLFYSKTIQCLVDSANEEHEVPINDRYYSETALGAAIGMGAGVALILISSIFGGAINHNLYTSAKTPFFDEDPVIMVTTLSLGASIGVNYIHSIMEVDVFYDDSLECLDYIPQVIGSAPEYVKGD